MKRVKNIIFIFIFTISMIALASCTIIDDTHIHCFEDGVCDCGDLEANYPDTTKYEVTLINGEEVVKVFSVLEGSLVPSIEDLEKEGQVFVGWFDGETEWDFAKMPVYGDLELVAHFVDNAKYDIIYQLNGGEFEEEVETSYVSGIGLATLPTPVRENYIFFGWYLNGELVDEISDSKMGVVTLVAKWSSIDYAITYNLNGGSFYDGAKIPNEYEEGKGLAQLPAAQRDCYNFLGWSLNGKIITSIAPDQVGAVELEAEWSPVVYEISYELDGGSLLEETVKEYTVEDEVALPKIEKEGYTFAGWYLEGELVEAIEVGSHGNLKLVANWTVNQYKLIINVDGKKTEVEYDYNEAVATPEVPTKEGYTFAKWNKEIPATMPAKDVEIVATWTINKYKFTVNVDGVKSDRVYDYNAAVEAPTAPVKVGYTFAGWNIEVPATMPAKDVEIVATWTINQYKLIIDVDGKKTEVEYDYNEAVATPEVPTKEGYTFAKWNKEIPATMPANDVEIVATWTINKYKFTVNVDGVKSDRVYDYNAAVEAPTAPAKVGYTFAGWSPEVPTTMPAKDVEIVATWTINQYKLIINVDGKKTEVEYDYNEAVATPEDPTKEGYTFVGWDKEIPTNMPANNVEIAPKWETIKYTITLSNEKEGVPYKFDSHENIKESFLIDLKDYLVSLGHDGTAINPEPGGNDDVFNITYTYSSNIAAFFTTHEVYSARWKWMYDYIAAKADLENTTRLRSNVHAFIYCIQRSDWPASYDFTNLQFSDYQDKLPESGVYEVEYTIEDKVALSELTKEGYNFLGWYLNEEKVEEIPVGTFGNITVEAKWQAVEYNISYELNGGTCDAELVKTYTVEQSVVLPEPTKSGYAFYGWYNGEEKVEEISVGTIGDIKLEAKWGISKYTATILNEKAPIPYKFDSHEAIKAAFFIDLKDYLVSLGHDGTAINPEPGGYYDVFNITYTYSSNIAAFFTTHEVYSARWKWMYDYIAAKADVEDAARLRSNVHAFIYCTYRSGWPASYDFTNLQYSDYQDKLPEIGLYEVEYTIEDKVPLSELTKEGYNFLGWYLNGEKIEEIPVGTFGNITVEAKWQTVEYNISYELNGGTCDTELVKTYTVEQSVVLPELTKEGYEFLGWYNGEEKVEEISAGTIGDIELKAKWELIKYTITYDFAGGYYPGYYETREEMIADLMADLNAWRKSLMSEKEQANYVDVPVPTADQVNGSSTAFYTTFNTYLESFYGDTQSFAAHHWDKWGWVYVYIASKTGSSVTFNTSTKAASSPGNWTCSMAGFIAQAPIGSGFPSNKGDFSNETTLPSTYVYPFATSFTKEQEVQLPQPTKEGYVFLGWYNANDELVEKIKVGTSADIHLTAEWEALPVEVTIAEAIELADGVEVIISGATVHLINYAWSDSAGNMSVTLKDGEFTLYVYKLTTEVELGDIINITGIMGTYNEERQISAGATAEITDHDTDYDVIEELTIEEAIAKANGAGSSYTSNKFSVTGTIINVASATNYGNLTISDGTYELYIYGSLNADGTLKYGQMSEKPAKGDTITIIGVLGTYSSTPQMRNGWIQEYTIHTHNYEDGKCTLCGEQDPNAEVTGITSTSADLNTISSTSTSYTESTTTDGWKAVYSAVLSGGTVNSNPKFTMIGDETTRAVCLNGNTSKVGKLTSPLIANGISKLTFNYGLPYSDTQISLTINILVDGEVVATKTISNTSASKQIAYEFVWELDTPVEGEFVIEITNNSPSNSSKNKDRTAIWNIQWENNN